MKYIKQINEEFGNEVSGSAAMGTLMDYDAFKLNGTNAEGDERSEVPETEQESEKITIVKDKSDRKQIG